MKHLQYLLNGLIKQNPTLVLLLGTCPTLAVTTSAVNGIGIFHFICSGMLQYRHFPYSKHCSQIRPNPLLYCGNLRFCDHPGPFGAGLFAGY